ncbi:ABC transporter ATP-binding protein [Mangrovicoccus algicola]|uniref:ABC transporter ATP-binding protein n=1 Tax=Mangrovicoccus algicola TaxID=2771008 RepID=A0A8J6YX22_9RHOB|nr:ABC transporter ATP-binding protein [Mangrovicoccus algicola]MBE3637864.1 ABC transporter ATP-binding protein [Mangrovicoccus algicola]
MPIVSVQDVTKTYASGFQALKGVNLEIDEGEILALLGPNGAGKTTLISSICGITRPSSGRILVGGHDVVTQYRQARRLIGLVPQELNLEPFAPVGPGVAFSRGLFGLRRDPARVEAVLRQLSLWEKRNARMRELSGGMKRRVLIAKALAHEPRVLFLDEPTAGVDVELRRDMWKVVAELKRQGVTIILTTHYIEEAEAIADRIGVIADGQILLVEEKAQLMARMGRKNLSVHLREPVAAIPAALAGYELELCNGGRTLIYSYDTKSDGTGITRLLSDLQAAGLSLRDLETRQSSLEDIFVDLVKERP